nr:infA [Carya glabra]
MTESLPNGILKIRLDNEDRILGYGSGRIWFRKDSA